MYLFDGFCGHPRGKMILVKYIYKTKKARHKEVYPCAGPVYFN
jgi:hypothetical protein